MIAALLAVLMLSAPAPQAREARVTITVVDQTGAVIPNARVTIAPTVDPKAAAVPGAAPPAPLAEPATTNEKGIATIGGLTPGRVTITAEFPGFEPRVLRDVQLRAGDNRHAAVLAIQGLQDSVTVSRDAREAASDRRTTFGTALTREQIEALSDDPDEMAQQLRDIAGSDAVLRVDSFEGGRLPPKAAIKAIHITRDAFAAENHFAGGLFVDIITQPGIGPLRTSMGVRLRDGSMSGRPPAAFAEQRAKGPERYQNYNGGISGSVIKQKASFSLNFSGGRNYETPYFYYFRPDGSVVNRLAPRRPRDSMFVFGMFDYAITRDQTLRVHFSRDRFTSRNIGVGGFNQLERAYASDDNYNNIRIQEAGPLGRRFFINTRASINWADSSSRSVFEGQTINVIETFTSGGGQRRGGVRSKALNLQSDLDYVRGIHSWRTGIALDGGSYRSNDESNYLGTYTFESLEAFLAGTPRSYTQRIGDPNIRYFNMQAGWYLQDDIRVRKNLTLSPGIRYEAQTHLRDYDNVGPRFGATWSPGKSGKLTLRGSAGVFYDWLFTNIYEQTLRVDGFRQREVNIVNPTYPDPGSIAGLSLPTNRYLLSDGLQMARNFRMSAGFDRQLTRMVRVNATYAHTSGDNLMRGRNLNSPVNGARPDPLFANIVEVLGDAESRTHSVNIGSSINFNAGGPAGGPMMIGGPERMVMIAGGAPPPPPPPGARPTPANARWNWRRMSIFTNVFLGRTLNNTEGAFSLPATGLIEDDWGPSNGDVRSRFNVGWSSQQLRGLNVNLNLNASTAPPYTLRTGVDTNGDLLFTDRPAGVGRNTERGSSQWTLNGNFSYGWTFGKPVERAGGISIRSDAGGITASQGAASTQGRYRLNLNANVQNLTNHHNLVGYTGTINSKNYGKPTSFQGTRKIDFGLSLSF
ncbi:MAG TPA: carboxypeptidase regulatory-like domain-containing protein [Vicinamibacterales bacterium]|nr:carboxypeptidase regulatory-like domain-containing protein [Vicinamibacterales bacterium]